MPQTFTLRKISSEKQLSICRFQMPVDFKKHDPEKKGWKLVEKTQEQEEEENEKLERWSKEERKEYEKGLSRHRREKLKRQRKYKRKTWNEWHLESSDSKKKYAGAPEKNRGEYVLMCAMAGRQEFIVADVHKTWFKFDPVVKARTSSKDLEQRAKEESSELKKRLNRYKFVKEGAQIEKTYKDRQRASMKKEQTGEMEWKKEFSDDEGMDDGGENAVQFISNQEEAEEAEELNRFDLDDEERDAEEEEIQKLFGEDLLERQDEILEGSSKKRKAGPSSKAPPTKRRKIGTSFEEKVRQDIINFVFDSEVPQSELVAKFIKIPSLSKKERKHRMALLKPILKELLQSVTISGEKYVKLKREILEETRNIQKSDEDEDMDEE